MISFIRGILVQAVAGFVVIDVGGIGYRARVPLSLGARLPEPGEECRLETYYMLRDERAELYGFGTERERELFGMLIGVSGVGPKAALALLSCLSAGEIERALQEGDAAVLQMVPGIGKKSAERILLELRDKFNRKEMVALVPVADAVEALVGLGYRRSEAQEMVRQAVDNGERDLESILRTALRLLLKRKGGNVK